MTRSRVLGRIAWWCGVSALVAGCMALPKLETAVFQDPLLERRGTLPLKAGMMALKDARPADERDAAARPNFLTRWTREYFWSASRRDIEDFAERVTLVMLTDLSEARVFTSIERAKSAPPPDVILRGEIRSFRWTPRYSWPPYVPGLGILAAFGVPVATASMDVEIALELVNPKNEQVVASYTRAARDTQSHWVYRYQDFRAGGDQEANSAFRRVAVDLQTAILEDREKIVAALK